MTKPAKPGTYEDALRFAEPIVHQILADSGTPGLAIGIFNRDGKIVDSYHGVRDINRKLPPDADTVFNLGSMCKGFTAVAIACLIADGKLHWDDRIDAFLPNLRASYNGQFTIRDLLSHRTGLCRSDALFIGSDNRLLLTKSQGINVFACLDASSPPRQDFIYNSFGYHAVECVIEQLSSMNYGDFLAQRIFKPLNMNRTFTKLPPSLDENIAGAYVPYYNLQLRQVPAPRISDDTVAFAAGCIRSSMRDLLIFYGAVLRKLTTILPEPVFEELNIICDDTRVIFEAVIPLRVSSSLREHSYGMGWARTQLPNQMGELSGNSGLLDAYPTIGDMINAPLVFHHGGNNLGCSSAVYLVPELQSGIAVLGNALGHCDATDWTAQLVIQAYLCGTVSTPFREYVIVAASQGRTAMERVQAMLDKEKTLSDSPSKLERYRGIFWDNSRQFRIVVTLSTRHERQELFLSFQGEEDEKYLLRHYCHDTFVFNETFDQVVNRGQWCRPHWFYKIEFLLKDTVVNAIRWRFNDTEEEGQIFDKLG